MARLVVLSGSLMFNDGVDVVTAWLSDFGDFQRLKKMFGGVFSKVATSKGTLYSLFVPDSKVRFLYLKRGERDE